MNKRGDIEPRDILALLLIYILMISAVASSTNISISENKNLPSPEKEPAIKEEPEEKNNSSQEEEPKNSQENKTKKEPDTKNQTKEVKANATKINNRPIENKTSNLTESKNITHTQNQTQQTIIEKNNSNNISKNQTNQTINTTLIQDKHNESELKIELIQGEAKVGKNVTWTKRIYTNNSNYRVEIPKQAKEIKKEFKEKKNPSEEIFFGISSQKGLVKENHIELIYETPAPKIEESILTDGKEVKIYSNFHYENVSAFTVLDEKLKIKNTNQIKIKWIEESTEIVPTSIQDKDNNGLYDYIEWTVPHLSNQTFQIIVITKAQHLDQNKTFISNIYEEVKELDDNWSKIISENEFVRVTFEKNLTNKNDITIFPKIISGNPSIEIYEFNKTNLVAKFENIKEKKYNKVFLKNLIREQDTFDLKILGGAIIFDHIIDPDTGFKFPSNSGDDYTAWTNPTNAYADNASYSEEITNGDQQDWYNFSLNIPVGSTIYGIEVETDSNDGNCDPNGAGIELSWDGGTSYTSSGQGFNGGCFVWATANNGNSTYLWERTWAIEELNNTNFRVRLSKTGANGNSLQLNYVSVKVYYNDTTPPASITSLANQSLSQTWIYWNWTDPLDSDFNNSIVYIDGVWKTNTTSDTYNATGLNPNTNYTITIHTMDETGNINDTDINHTATTLQVENNFTILQNGATSWYDFNTGGTASKTEYNGSIYAAVLESGETSGNYTSQIFDIGSTSNWNNISWQSSAIGELPDNQEIESSFASGNINMTGNVLLMHLNDGVGTASNIIDTSGTGNNGTTTFTGSGTCSGVSGKMSGACSFDGSGDYINIPDDTSLRVTDMTISAWVYIPSSIPSGFKMIVEHGRSTSNWYLLAKSDVSDVFHFRWSTGTVRRTDFQTTIQPDTWYHVVGTLDTSSSTAVAYLNGEIDTTVGSADAPTTASGPVNIGAAAGPTEAFNGTIDEVAIWNRSLSASEIKALYKRGITRLNLTARSCDDAACSGESFTNINNTSPQNLTLSSNQYFQYNFDFETDNASYTPELYNVTANYIINSDTTPPASITSLANQSLSQTWIYWNWTNPLDSDFNQSIISINGINTENTTNNFYNATSLSPGTNYTITVHTKDHAGNINSTDVNSTATTPVSPDTTPPASITSLANQSLSQTWIYWNWTNPLDSDFNNSIVYIDGAWKTNTTSDSYNATGLTPGTNYTITVHTMDETGNINSTDVNSTTTTIEDLLSPQISYGTGTESTGTNFSRDWIFVNVSVVEENEANITFKLFNSTSQVNQTTYLTPTRSINWTNLPDETYYYNVSITDLANNFNSTQTRQINLDSTGPAISIISPKNNSGDSDGNITFQFNVTDANNIANCSLIFNGTTNQTNTNTAKDTTISFQINNLPIANYNWSITCFDSLQIQSNSGNRYLDVIIMTDFNGISTDISNVDTRNISNFILENTTFGKIKFTENLNLSGGLNLNSLVSIDNNTISVDEGLGAQLDKAANLTLYNVTYENAPYILIDGQICTASTCTLNNFSNSIIDFNVSGFSVYSTSPNSKLSIWDDTDPEGGDLDRYISENVSFFANYTNLSSGSPINGTGSDCTISIDVEGDISSNLMTFNASSSLYEYQTKFYKSGIYQWEVECNASSQGYEKASAIDLLVAIRSLDFLIQEGNVTIPAGQSTVTIIRETGYIPPSLEKTAFIRIVGTRLSGVGSDVAGGIQDPEEFMVSISNPENIMNNITFERYSSSATYDTKIYWEIIEYTGPTDGGNKMIVRAQDEISQTSGTNMNGQAVEDIVNASDVVVMITGQRHNGGGVDTTMDRGLYTSELKTGNIPSFTRGDGSGESTLSYAVLEFAGENWNIQRVEHTYVGTTEETESITQIGSVNKAFTHPQLRTTSGNLDEQGQRVWISDNNTVSFQLDSGAVSSRVGVAWVLENTQADLSENMNVQHISGTRSAGAGEPDSWTEPISQVSRLDVSSVMGESSTASGTGSEIPRGSIGLNLGSISNTTLWRSDTGATENYRFDVVEWPSEPTNFPPTDPDNIECEGASNCDIAVDSNITINSSGSMDYEGGQITYVIEAKIKGISKFLDSLYNNILGSGGGAVSIGLFEDWESYSDSDTTIAGSEWTNVGGDDCDWMTDSGGTPSTNTGPTTSGGADHTVGAGGEYFYMETSAGYCVATNDVAIVESATTYDADVNLINVSFWYHMFGSTIGTLYFEVYDGTWNTEWSLTGAQGDVWYNHVADLSSYSGNIQFRFRGVSAGAYYSDFAIDDINITTYPRLGGTDPTSEVNKTATTYQDVSEESEQIESINISIEVDSYNPSASEEQSTTYPDLYLQIWNGTSWIEIGNYNLSAVYTGSSLNTTNHNFSLETTNSQILSAWENISNQDVRIIPTQIDYYNTTTIDEINYTNLWVQINGKSWKYAGNHTESTSLVWNTSSVKDQTEVNLRTKAIDVSGGNSYSEYYTKGNSLTIDHIYPTISFQGNTQNSGVALSQNFIHTNVTVNETNPSNITYSLYNSTDLVEEKTFQMQTQNSNTTFDFTYLPNGIYYYNATIKDGAGHSNSTETRTITLDTIGPGYDFSSPPANTHSNNNTQNLTVNATDNIGLKEAVLYIFNSSGLLINTTNISISGVAVTLGIIYTFLAEGVYTWFYKIIDLADHFYETPNRTITIDTTAPNITLKSPINNSGSPSGNLIFEYNITDYLSDINNCSLIINETISQTDTSITKNITQSISESGLGLGTYNWSISCFDEAENNANSETRYFYVVDTSTFNGATTDVSTIDMGNISNFILEISSYGKISYNENLDLSGVFDLASLVSIGQAGVYVDSVSESKLNKSATIEMYNLNYEFLPIILKDGNTCTDCQLNYYTGGNMSFNVTSFSSYNLSENSELSTSYESTVLAGTNTDLKFLANYTNLTSGQSISSADCNVSFTFGEFSMTYNSSSSLFEYNRTFSTYGIYDYNISCFGSALGYENLTTQDSAVVEFQENLATDKTGYLTQSGIYNFAGLDEFIPLDYPVSNLSKAFVMAPNLMNQENVTASDGGDSATNPDDSFVSLYLYNSTHIRAQRSASDDGPVVVTWQVFEAANNEFEVQRGETYYSGSSTTVNDTIPSAVNTTNSMSWFYINTSYATNRGDVTQFYSNLTDNTTIQFTREESTVSTAINFRWVVVEWNMSQINNFAKGYTGAITGPDTSPDCFSIGSTINKSSSILFHQSHALNDADGGLDSSTRAGYIQDGSTICFYDYDGGNNAGVKWFLIDIPGVSQREENQHVDWGTSDYSESISFSGSYDTNKTLFWLSGTCNGDGPAKPRHTQWWNFSSSGASVERTYGGQAREYAWQVLELPYVENIDVPNFFNPSVNQSYAANGQILKFTIDVNDSSDSINETSGIIGGIERSFTKGAGDSWYYDYVCSANEDVSFIFVLAKDNGQIQRANGTAVNGVSATCDSIAPTVSFISPDTPANGIQTSNSFFSINTTITETNFQEVIYELYNSTSLVTRSNFSSPIENIRFDNLESETYYYNVTVIDLAGNVGSTETRSIILDKDAPQISYGQGMYPSGDFASSSEIFVNTTIIETNFKNVTFYIYDEFMAEERTPVTYTDDTRSLTWTLLDDGIYFYNVSAYDTLENFNFTETRNVTLDTLDPVVIYETGTAPEDSYFSTDGIFINVSYTEIHFKNITFNVYNNTGLVQTQSPASTEYQFGPLASAEYWYNVTVCDLADNCGTLSTRKITLDEINPVVNFASPTETDSTNVSRNWAFINSSITEPNFKNITFKIYDSSHAIVNSTSFTDSTRSINFTNLESDIYYYNISVYDKAGNLGSSSTRRIGLDYLGPSIQLLNPKAKAYGTNISLPLDYTVTDAITGTDTCWYNLDNTANTTVSCSGSATFNTTDGQHTLHFFANDTFNNIDYKNVTFLVSTTGPAIQLLKPEDQTFYSQATEVFFNYTAEDPDLTESCSLYGTWNGGWHLNQTDSDWIIGGSWNETENFTSQPGDNPAVYVNSLSNWENVGGDDFDWTVDLDQTASGTTTVGPTTDHTGGTSRYIFTEASSPRVGGDEAFFQYNTTLDADTNAFALDFWYNMNGEPDMGALYLDVNQDGSGWDLGVWSVGDLSAGGDLGDMWFNQTVDLEAEGYNTGSLQIRFRGVMPTSGTVWNSDMALDDIKIIATPGKNKPSGNFTTNLSNEGNYLWNVECNDTKGYTGSGISNFTLGIDTTNPVVDFGTSTPVNGTRTGSNSLYVDANITELNLDNITFDLYKAGILVDTQTYSNGRTNHTFNGLTGGTYQYNISAYDKAGRFGNSSTRSIELDLTNPTGTLTSPGDGYFTKETIQNLTATVGDLIELKDAILFIYNSTGGLVYSTLISLTGLTTAAIGVVYEFLYDDVFSWFYQVTDSVNNSYNTTANSIEIDSIAPVITLVSPTTDDAEIVLRDWIFINTTVYEKNYGNLTFWLYNGEGIKTPSPNTFSDSTRSINYTLLPDDTYYYNVSSFDSAGNEGYSETREITLDTTSPVVNFNGATKANNSVVTGSSITADVIVTEANEENITFAIYNSTGGLAKPLATYLDGRRSVTWTLLDEGVYYYNVTVIDAVSQSGSTQTRKISIDNTAPQINLSSPTEVDTANKSQHWIFVNTTFLETNPDNITFYLYNETGSLISNQTNAFTTTYHNFTGLTDGIYYYNATILDRVSKNASTETRKITLDTIAPQIYYTSPTPPNGSVLNQDWVVINMSISDKNFYKTEGIAYSGDLVYLEVEFYQIIGGMNFTDLDSGRYTYNATTYDWAGNSNSSEIRHIALDIQGPEISIPRPEEGEVFSTNISLPLKFNIYDEIIGLDSCWYNIDLGTNQSIDCATNLTFNTSEGQHSIFMFANDTFGNENSEKRDFAVSLYGPAIDLREPENDTFFNASAIINFSFTSRDPDFTDTCSLYGDWNGGWHKNDTYAGDWWDPGWAKRRDIKINNTGTTTITNISVYYYQVSEGDYVAEHLGYVDYSDLFFFNGSCAENQGINTSLPYSIETFDDMGAYMIVQVPEIPVEGASFCVYYANTAADNDDREEEVWDDDYSIVYLMDTEGLDSTPNGYDRPLNIGTPTTDTTYYGHGINFSNGNAWNMANLAYWEAGYSTRAQEILFRAGSNVTTRQVIFAEGGGTNGIMMYILNGELYARWWTGANDNVLSTPISANQLYYTVMSYDFPGNYSLYLNGELKDTGSTTFAIGAHSGDGGIGYTGTTAKDFEDTSSAGHYFTGSIFDFKVRDTVPSADFVNISYLGFFNPQSFIELQEVTNFTPFSVPFSEEATYNWNIECNDTKGFNSTAINNFSFTLDATPPQVFFGTGTESNNTNVGRNWVLVDANLIENNFKNITFNLYNSTSLVDSDSFSDSTRQTNFTNLPSGRYYYNITVYDKANFSGYSQTREINLDLTPPTADLNTPTNNSFLNNIIQNLTATFSDATGLLNATLYVLNATGHIIHTQVVELSGALSATIGVVYNFLTEGIYSWFYEIEDTVGNKINTTSNSLTIDTTPPLIDYTFGTESSGQIFERENVFINITTSDTYWKNLTFYLYDSDSQVFANTFSDSTREVNWTNLPDETYYYNVTARDSAGNTNTTTTRNITLDNLDPVISYTTGTNPNAALISGDSIFLNVSVTEPNEANITFNLYNETGYNTKSHSYTTPERDITWTLIPEGKYYYNVTIVDKVGHFASTTTRSITLDATAPQVSYGFGTLPNNTHINQDWIFLRATVTEPNFQNVTLSLYNSTGTVQQITFTNTSREINFTNLIDAEYWVDITSCDQATNCNTTSPRYTTLDSISPAITFTSPTEIDNFNKTQNWIFINTSATDTNFQNITFSLYNQSSIINQTTFTDGTRSINFTNLPSKVYRYNVTTQDKAGNSNSTEERRIGLDYLGPSIQLLNPKAKAYGTNISLPLDYTVTDAITGTDTCWYNLDNTANTTVSCSGSATFNTTDGQHTLHFFANDTFNNIDYKNVTFLVSTTGPAIQLLKPEDQTFYSQATEVFFNYTAEDPDLTESCSLYGTWNGGWHLNQTDSDWIIGGSWNETENFTSQSQGDPAAYNGALSKWKNVGGDDFDWDVEWDATTSGTTTVGPTTDHTGGTSRYVYTEATGTNRQLEEAFFQYNTTLDADVNYFNLSFWYNMNGEPDMGALHVDVNQDGGGWDLGVWSVGNTSAGGDLGDVWINQVIDLEAEGYDSGSLQIRFRAQLPDVTTFWHSDIGLDDIQIIAIPASNKPSGNFTLNLSEEGSHDWNVECNDTLGYVTSSVDNFTITFDVTDPVVTFGANTLENNSNVSQNFIYINSSVVENNFANITFYVYNSTGLVTSRFFNDSTRDHTFLGLSDGTYYYNITVFDSASRSNSTPTRQILLDTTPPTGSPVSPSDNLITNNATQNLTATLSDENGLTEAILYIFNQTGLVYSQVIPLVGELSTTIGILYTFLTDGVYEWFYQAEDTIGNLYNTTNYTITIDTTPPQINFISPTLPNNTYRSQRNIFANVSIIEANFKNITFDLFNGEGIYETYTFTNSKRDINYTLLPDDEYFYSITSSDTAGNTNTSELRIITLDNIPPTSNYVSPTQVDTANKSQNFIFINSSISDINFANVTYRLYLESTLINTTTYQTKTEQINFTSLSNGIYFYNATITDKTGQTSILPTRKITLDTIDPILFFIAPTEDSGTVLEQEHIFMDTFLTEINFKNITFYLYNQTSLLNQTTFTTPITQINFTAPGTNVTYFYNATVFDITGNSDSTATRNITLIDTTYPTLLLTSPENRTYAYNTSLRVSYNVYDVHLDSCWYNLNSGTNITMPNCQSVIIDVADEQSHRIKVFANDTLGYTVSENVTFFVNSSLINLPETYSVQRGTIFTDGTSIESTEEIHPTKGFILHTVRAGGSSPATLQVTSDFTGPEEITFKNYESGAGAVVDWSLIAGPNISVQRGEIQYTTETTLPLSITQVNLSNSFIIVNNRLNSTTSSENTNGFWTGKFTDDSNINFTRSSSSAGGTLSYQVVSWDGATIQSGSSQISNTASTATGSISTLNPNKTFMIFSKRASNTAIQNSMLRGEIKNSTALEFTRTGTSGTVDIEWFTVSSPLFVSQHKNHSHTVSSSPQYSNIPNPLINTSRSFDIHSNENDGASSSFATAYLTQNIQNKTAIVLQKGVATAAGTTSWSAIEITELDAPIITLEDPVDTKNFSMYTIPPFNFTISDESAILNCSLYGNWSGSWHLNQTILNPTKETTTNFTSIEVESDNYYSWNIKCIDAYQNTAWAPSNFTFAAFLPPTKPTIYTINQTSNDGLGNITLSWNASNHSAKYEIHAGLTIPTISYLTETTNTNYTDSNFSGQKRRFYKIVASNPTGQNSSEIFGAHRYELKHNNIKSRNWIAFPSNFSYLNNANKTLNEIPQSIAFTTFNSTTQTRVTCNEFSCPETISCTATNCNFETSPGKSYEVNINTSLSQEVNWSAVGKVYGPKILNLTKNVTSFGKNWISLCANTTFSNAQDLIIDIPNADALSKWNRTTQESQGLIPSPIPWIPGFIGKNFQLNLEEGYEVSVTSSTQWTQS